MQLPVACAEPRSGFVLSPLSPSPGEQKAQPCSSSLSLHLPALLHHLHNFSLSHQFTFSRFQDHLALCLQHPIPLVDETTHLPHPSLEVIPNFPFKSHARDFLVN